MTTMLMLHPATFSRNPYVLFSVQNPSLIFIKDKKKKAGTLKLNTQKGPMI